MLKDGTADHQMLDLNSGLRCDTLDLLGALNWQNCRKYEMRGENIKNIQIKLEVNVDISMKLEE